MQEVEELRKAGSAQGYQSSGNKKQNRVKPECVTLAKFYLQ
jgi:hypothetical protein